MRPSPYSHVEDDEIICNLITRCWNVGYSVVGRISSGEEAIVKART